MQIGLWNKITIDAQQQCLAISWNLNTQFKWNCCGSNLIEFKVLKLDQNQSCTQGIDVDFSDFGIWMWFACSGNQQLYASNRPQTSFYPKKKYTAVCCPMFISYTGFSASSWNLCGMHHRFSKQFFEPSWYRVYILYSHHVDYEQRSQLARDTDKSFRFSVLFLSVSFAFCYSVNSRNCLGRIKRHNGI